MSSAAFRQPEEDGPRYPRLAHAAVEPHVFLEAVSPLLEQRNLEEMAKVLRDLGGAERIVPLLDCSDSDVRKVAALSLALVGDGSCIEPLALCLQSPDPMVNQMAEHALWSIWFRGGNAAANTAIAQGAEAMNARKLKEAAGHFSDAIMLDGGFAEAYNQRAIVRYLQERFGDSLADCERAAELMPQHFGAWASMGHCHLHRGHLRDAHRCYVEALRINPHLECVRELVREIESCTDDDADDALDDDVS